MVVTTPRVKITILCRKACGSRSHQTLVLLVDARDCYGRDCTEHPILSLRLELTCGHDHKWLWLQPQLLLFIDSSFLARFA